MRLPLALLAGLMLLSGSLNTIFTKYQDNVIVHVIPGDEHHPDRAVRFRHPVVQTATMFLGEALCLLPFLCSLAYSRWFRNTTVNRSVSTWDDMDAAAASHAQEHTTNLPTREWTSLQRKRLAWFGRVAVSFSIPAFCDAMATTLLNLGLFFTYASVFQMLRGTLVIFAGLLTIAVLRRRLHSQHWMGMALITAGAALVGASSIMFDDATDDHDADDNPTAFANLEELSFGLQTRERFDGSSSAPDPLLGNALVIAAQALNAMQFIVEEKFIRTLHPPILLAVGAEGAAGVILSTIALPVLSRLRWPDGTRVDDPKAALHEIGSNWTLKWTTLGAILSIALFNFAGISVTQQLSGASRAAIDACRTATVWLFCIFVRWERFHMLQLVGFAILITGSSVYNDILRSCLPEPYDRRGPSSNRSSTSKRRSSIAPSSVAASSALAAVGGAEPSSNKRTMGIRTSLDARMQGEQGDHSTDEESSGVSHRTHVEAGKIRRTSVSGYDDPEAPLLESSSSEGSLTLDEIDDADDQRLFDEDRRESDAAWQSRTASEGSMPNDPRRLQREERDGRGDGVSYQMIPRSRPVPAWNASRRPWSRGGAFAMARSVTLLPSAWSPHSLASLPRGLASESQHGSELIDSSEDGNDEDAYVYDDGSFPRSER